MITKLSIQNYAIIDKLDISIDKGLNIITGETGAGKSIIIGAFSLLMGERADSLVVQNKTEKCIVEAHISVKGLGLKKWFAENELDYDDETIIRREVQPTGKSRAFINDSPVTLSVLSELAERFVDLHRQHQTLSVNTSSFQLELIDTIAQQTDAVSDYSSVFSNYKKSLNKLNSLQQEQSKLNAEADFNTFQLNELSEAELKDGEQELLEGDLKIQENAEQLKKSISDILQQVAENDDSIVSRLKTSLHQVASLTKINTKLQAQEEKLRAVIEEVKDIQAELEDEYDQLSFDAEKFEFINSRLDTIYRLQKKHRVNDIAALLTVQNALEGKVQSVTNKEEEITKLETEISQMKTDLLARAKKISDARNKTVPVIEKKVNALLKEVGMPNAQVKINITTNEELSAAGIDAVEILFTANKGSRLEPINKVASGGELSRLMLCLKSLVAKTIALPTLIFDEIDSGISGEAAQKVGKLMKEMSNGHQLICITHLPQIAAKADKHFFVYKETVGNNTLSRIRILDEGERVVEIAKMLSGDKPGKAALQNAKELIVA